MRRARCAPTPGATLRELLAMASCHSKSKVPVAVLNDPRRLRRADADRGRHRPRDALPAAAGRGAGLGPGRGLPDGFGWLEAAEGPGRALVEDVIDTLRVLRCADALRQRGTELKTSGGYEIFVDARSGNAVFALRPIPARLCLLEVDDPIVAGEANVAASQLDRDGNLRIAFHHGAFRDAETARAAARNAALMVNDIQADAIGSFARADPAAHPELRAHAELPILLESVAGIPGFAPAVALALAALDPVAGARVRIVAAPRPGPATRGAAHRPAARLGPGAAGRRAGADGAGRAADRSDRPRRGVRRGAPARSLEAGERLIAAGAAPDFVYVPLGPGVSGAAARRLRAVRGAGLGSGRHHRGDSRRRPQLRRLAERAMEFLAIPKEIFLAHWPVTCDRHAFAALFRAAEAGGG